MRSSTVQILKEFLELGGRVIFSGEIPQYVDGVESKAVCELAAHPNAVTIPFEKQALAEAARKTSSFYPVVEGEGAESVFVQMRYDADRKLLYAALLNTDRENPRASLRLSLRDPSGAFSFREAPLFAEQWDLASGKRFRKELSIENGVPAVTFGMEAAGEKIFVFTREEDPSLETPEKAEELKQ